MSVGARVGAARVGARMPPASLAADARQRVLHARAGGAARAVVGHGLPGAGQALRGTVGRRLGRAPRVFARGQGRTDGVGQARHEAPSLAADGGLETDRLPAYVETTASPE